jgi:hypothetical protein
VPFASSLLTSAPLLHTVMSLSKCDDAASQKRLRFRGEINADY